MKNIIRSVILLSLLLDYDLFSQSSSIHLVTTNPAGTNTISVINNGGGYSVTTTASSQLQSDFRFYNIDANTHTYNVLRKIITLNSQGTATASTFFCVGATCLPPNANTLSNSGDYITLSTDSFDKFIIYFDEISTVGYSEVYYKIFDVNNSNDTLSFTIYYNPLLNGINEATNPLENIFVYPIPADDYINIQAKVNYPTDIDIFITNILGRNVIRQHLNVSDNLFKKQINISALSEGIYFLIVKTNDSNQKIFTKKIIVNK